jgi:hypothetical protein
MPQRIRFDPHEVQPLLCAARGVSGLPLTVKDGSGGFLCIYNETQAQGELVRRFGPLIARFVRICLTGRFREGDKHAIAFLKLFAKEDTHAENIAMMLKKRLRYYHKQNDLYQEGVIAFLETLHSGSENIAGAFPGFFRSRIRGLIQDPMHSPKNHLEVEVGILYSARQINPDPSDLNHKDTDFESFLKALSPEGQRWVELVLQGEEAGPMPEGIEEFASVWLL